MEREQLRQKLASVRLPRSRDCDSNVPLARLSCTFCLCLGIYILEMFLCSSLLRIELQLVIITYGKNPRAGAAARARRPLPYRVCRAARGGRPRYDKLINECCTKLVVNERSPAAFMRYYSPSESVWSVQPPDTGGGHTHTRLACRELVL